MDTRNHTLQNVAATASHAAPRQDDPHPQSSNTSNTSNTNNTNNINNSFQHSNNTSTEDINPRARKRRRADSGASSNNSIAAADHQELAELYSNSHAHVQAHHGLQYNSGPSGVHLHPLDTGISSSSALVPRYGQEDHRPAMSMAVGDMYSLAHEKMIASVQRAPPSSKYNTPTEYGPYHAQYWSLVQHDLDAGTPLAANGGYQSPYGSLAPEIYFAASVHENNNYHYDHGEGGQYGSSRQAGYNNCVAPEAANVYPSPVENFGWPYSSVDPGLQMQNLPALDNLSAQILQMILTSTVEEFMATVTQPDTPNGQNYAAVESLFEQTTRHFIREHQQPFIDFNQIPINSNAALVTIRKANLVIFALSIFRGRDVPFMELNDIFLDIFMPAGSRLFKNEGSLFLELKTQAYMAVMLNSDLPKEDVLDQLFPRDLQLTILRRRQEPAHLAPSEQDFISRLNTRRQYLLAGSDDLEALSQLPRKYTWMEFLDELRACVRRNLEYLDSIKDAPNVPDDPITKAALAAHAAISGQPAHGLQQYHSPTVQVHTPTFNGSHKRKRSSPSSDASSLLSPDSPTAPMHMQYKHARATSNPKNSPFSTSANVRRLPGTPSTRRPWTPEEEKALMDGLERVKGPHWSQILALYGAGGSISEILKDRNQVQLKDKARNLKLFFLKSGLEVPYFLQKVTGELKTRAPAQAAKLEARERMKMIEVGGRKRGVVGLGVKLD